MSDIERAVLAEDKRGNGPNTQEVVILLSDIVALWDAGGGPVGYDEMQLCARARAALAQVRA